ncbi:NB-ARC domain disease resistance protein [Medicago truncatula]|uniref:NB-ARC domain disease resistance protein n=2 Tax=Medicago truncatula TaxID=3880 RepID=A0A072VE63_MEDTR|nr:NB-ARC domain disease resistance protein [Medicago truncatula]
MKNLESSSKQVVTVMNSICVTLDQMHNQLRKAEETEGIKACVKQLKVIVHELENLQPEQYVTGTEFNPIEMKNTIDLLQQLTETCTIRREDSAKVVGLKIKEQDLVLNLTASSDNASKLCIVGMKGVGKTALAKAVCYNKVVVKHFPTQVWATVIAGATATMKVLLMENNGTKNQTLTMKQVRGHLKDKLCLVVLDNVSQKSDFNNLYKILSESGWRNGSRIVVTTCFKVIASHVDSSSTPHHIRLLTKEESWALFQKVASIETDVKKLELKKLENFAKKVVGKCGGLILAIISLGFVMSAKDVTQDSLSWVFQQLNHGRYKTHWLQAWKNNKDEMSETVRNCLYYFTKFPLDYEISARRLVNLWVGEGLVQVQNDQNTPEETAESYLEELRDRSMIQVVALKPNGKIKTCCLPSMLKEIILQNNSRTNHSRYFGMHLDQRFAYNFDDDGLDANSAQAFRKKGIPLSVLFFDKGEGSKPGERVGNILSTGIASEQFLKTRVLDLECIFRPQLPKNLSKLNNLKYLSLRWTYLEELPLCICKLLELETLDLKHTSINYIPSSIWELKKLKKLYLPQTHRSKLEGKLRGNVNETLQTLWGVFLYGNYPLLSHLHKLKSLQKLKLAFQLNGSEQESQNTLAQKIVNLEQLHSLSLKSVDEAGDPDKLISINMSKLEKLSSLRLYGKLEERLL